MASVPKLPGGRHGAPPFGLRLVNSWHRGAFGCSILSSD
ncbi:MAG: hypothetical protein AVDCRST_MAG90-1556 [uncultured Microvirga sp.]|uniref:Uncharacterized protein n=1 Tax=uncultured Microvirga sp. TaxID=412392 RepID=A0A6J4L123_9HYPH|nr:MAG: hypothetical protein AVDCRST_MAG90-1556 [uncultured Microvirga sp.]